MEEIDKWKGDDKMAERNLNFDQVVDRYETDSLKYDFAVQRGMTEDILPLWVADMDFPTTSYVEDALMQRTHHGIYGYSESRDSYFHALSGWMKRHHQWEVQREWLIETPGVVFAIAAGIRAFSKENDGVLIQQPVYYPFANTILKNNRKLISNDLVYGEDHKYHIDFEDFEKQIIENKVKLFILCNPHNPVGRVWKREELLQIGEICLKHHVIVISDEIHQDFTYGENKHTVFASLSDDIANITITCTAPTKTFNLAGLQISNIFVSNWKLREELKSQIDMVGYSQPNVMGIIACEAAYQYGEEWYRHMISYIHGNIEYMRRYLETELPMLTLVDTEGTYLVWVDFRRLNLPEDELEELIVKKAKLWLDSGKIFGETGKGFQRFNVACPRATLAKALEQLKNALHTVENIW